MLSASIFMMIYFMDGAKMKVGAALGLFAVFGIIRYRTEAVPIREMTYLFFIVALSVVNGMSSKLSIAELLIANMIFILVAKFTESSRLIKRVACKYVRYDNINLITPEKREDMMEDLKKKHRAEHNKSRNRLYRLYARHRTDKDILRRRRRRHERRKHAAKTPQELRIGCCQALQQTT